MTTLSRRRFLGGAAVAAALHPLTGHGQEASKSKIKIGLIGAGGRGAWIGGLFQEHGGYQIHAVADYFQEVAGRAGDTLGVDKSRCFSGLSGFQKVIESGVDAVVLETPPYFMPDQAVAAVAAGLHVFMAKPVAVDVPGCLAIETAAAEAARKQKVFLVDYQMPTDPLNIEVVRRIHDESFGPLLQVQSLGIFTNKSVRRSIDGCFACILGREAAARGVELTMEQHLRRSMTAWREMARVVWPAVGPKSKPR